MNTIILSVGHNLGKNSATSTAVDRGASGFGTTEYDEVNKIIDVVMQANTPGLKLIKIPNGLNLTQRIAWTNKVAATQKVDYCLEFHMDAGAATARGCMSYFYGGSRVSEWEATKFINAYAANAYIENDGVRPDTVSRFGSLGWIRQTKPLALLIELGFITNGQDIAQVREKWVIAILRAMYTLTGEPLPAHLTKVQPVTPTIPVPKVCSACGRPL